MMGPQILDLEIPFAVHFFRCVIPSVFGPYSCTFHSVGTAAGEQKFNSLCVLSLNIINEKIYLLLWFWFYLLALLTGFHLLYRMCVIVMPFSRYYTTYNIEKNAIPGGI